MITQDAAITETFIHNCKKTTSINNQNGWINAYGAFCNKTKTQLDDDMCQPEYAPMLVLLQHKQQTAHLSAIIIR